MTIHTMTTTMTTNDRVILSDLINGNGFEQAEEDESPEETVVRCLRGSYFMVSLEDEPEEQDMFLLSLATELINDVLRRKVI